MCRAKQREGRRIKAYEMKQGLRDASGREEKLDRQNAYGNQDLTPFLAVNDLIRSEKALRLRKMGITVTSAFGASLLGGG